MRRPSPFLSAAWDGVGGAAPERTVLCTDSKGAVPTASSGGGGAGLRPAGAAAGQGGER
jgi:hypothetical protein